ncbi:hypothetical protein REC12_19170 [Desulfosporosinus sp. PR]|nr:hypothetical protein [Desulfosporosinus sp. PR]MDQ7095715.1 hypothetical protein [Desulfosporosinus sp. PR]
MSISIFARPSCRAGSWRVVTVPRENVAAVHLEALAEESAELNQR